ncbi:MAG: HutD family protein [Bacillota bacterium]
MSYRIDILRKEEQKIMTWSGGTTNQLAIYPKDADYSQRSFLWRISSAKVEADESVFTHLPGIWRLIMVLDGEMKLEHEGHHSICLKPFEKDSFSGEWTTRSFGRVTDFNLMMAPGCRGDMQAISLNSKEKQEIADLLSSEMLSEKLTDAFYCYEGTVNIVTGTAEEVVLEKGDFLLINRGKPIQNPHMIICNTSQITASIIRVSITY